MTPLSQPWPLRSGRTSWLIAAAICVALLAGFALFDIQISHLGQSLPSPVVEVFAWITRLGESDYIVIPSLVLLIVTVGLGFIIPKPVAKRALLQMAGVWAFILAGVGLPSLFTTLVKRLIGRSRPELADSVGSFDFRTLSWEDWTYQSFPSGHTTTAFALCFVIGFLSPRSFPWMLGLAVLIGVSRIVVGAHYPTDVIGGAVVGTLGAYLIRNVFAAISWVFQRLPDGSIAMRSLIAVRRLMQRRG
jgi:membrane-associated phospholipid phosphatase